MSEPKIPEGLTPRDLLVHLRQWLTWHRELHTKHFGDSDDSGHPHGYDGVVIPVWDLRQRFDEIEASIALKQPRLTPIVCKDHPEANGRIPQKGEHGYTLKFPMADGSDLELLCGEETLMRFSDMIGRLLIDIQGERA